MSGHAGVDPRLYRMGVAVREREAEGVAFDLPGCQWQARDERTLVEIAPVVIAEHMAWLDQHGDVTRDAFPFEVEVVERVDVAALGDEIADAEFCFADDLRPVGRDELETAIRRMSYARQDLMDVVRHLPDQVLDWPPPPGAVRADAWAAGARTIRGILKHIAGSDGYYAGNAGDAPWDRTAQRGGPDLFDMRQRAIERLRGLSVDELGTRYERRQPWQRADREDWTVRKALRRIISHERFHTKEIEQQLAWLLVGAPELAPVASTARARAIK